MVKWSVALYMENNEKNVFSIMYLRASRWLNGKESACQCKRLKKHGFDTWVRKITWSRKWQPFPVFLPAKFHGKRSPVHYGPWGCTIRHDWANTHTYIHFVSHIHTDIWCEWMKMFICIHPHIVKCMLAKGWLLSAQWQLFRIIYGNKMYNYLEGKIGIISGMSSQTSLGGK